MTTLGLWMLNLGSGDGTTAMMLAVAILVFHLLLLAALSWEAREANFTLSTLLPVKRPIFHFLFFHYTLRESLNDSLGFGRLLFQAPTDAALIGSLPLVCCQSRSPGNRETCPGPWKRRWCLSGRTKWREAGRWREKDKRVQLWRRRKMQRGADGFLFKACRGASALEVTLLFSCWGTLILLVSTQSALARRWNVKFRHNWRECF